MEERLKPIPDPLRSIIRRSPYAQMIPTEWYNVTMAYRYPAQSRHFADSMKARDPELICAFIRADLNVALRDPTVKIWDLTAFLGDEYNIGPETAAEVGDIESMPRLIAITEEVMRRRPNATPACVTNVAIPVGHIPIHSHTSRDDESPIVPRSDWLVVAVSNMSRRLNNATRVPPTGTQTEENATPESSEGDVDQQEQLNDFLTEKED